MWYSVSVQRQLKILVQNWSRTGPGADTISSSAPVFESGSKILQNDLRLSPTVDRTELGHISNLCKVLSSTEP